MITALFKLVDKLIGTPLCIFFGFASRLFPNSKKQPNRIAVLKLWAIGDSVVSLPLIRALREKFPNATIDVIVRKRNAAVFKNNKDITRLVFFEWQDLLGFLPLFLRYDVVIDTEPWMRLSALVSLWLGRSRIGFGGQARSIAYTITVPFDKTKHMMKNYLAMAEAAGAIKPNDQLIPLLAMSDERDVVDAFVAKQGLGNNFVGICPAISEASKTRMWLPERFAQLADLLVEKYNVQVVFVGSPNERSQISEIQKLMKHNSISTAGELTLRQAFDIIKRCKLFISIDTGPLHIAAAQGVPTIGIFGPNTPVLWAPYGPNCIALYHELPCSPCINNETGYVPDCLRKTERYLCMKLITVDEVLHAADKLLASAREKQ